MIILSNYEKCALHNKFFSVKKLSVGKQCCEYFQSLLCFIFIFIISTKSAFNHFILLIDFLMRAYKWYFAINGWSGHRKQTIGFISFLKGKSCHFFI